MEHILSKVTVESIKKHIDESGTYWCPFSRRFITPGVPEVVIIDSLPLLAPSPTPLSDETKQIFRQVLQDLRQLSIEFPPQIREMVYRTRFPEYEGLGEMERVCPGETPYPIFYPRNPVRFEMQLRPSDVERPNMVFTMVKARTSNHPKGTATYMDGHLRFDNLPESGDDRPVQD